MEALLITLGAIAVAVCLLITILKSNRCDSLQTEVDILRKRNSTLEEKFGKLVPQKEQSISPDEPQITADALETIARFAIENGCKLEHLDAPDSDWIIHSMTYQGGHFIVYTRRYEMMLRFYDFAELEYTSDSLTQLLMLCLRFNNHSRYFKLDYDYKQESNLFSLSIYIELINPPYESLESILDANWNAVNIVRREIEHIREECGMSNTPTTDSNPQAESEGGQMTPPIDVNSLISIHKSSGGEA